MQLEVPGFLFLTAEVTRRPSPGLRTQKDSRWQDASASPDDHTVGFASQAVYFFHGDLVDFVIHLRLKRQRWVVGRKRVRETQDRALHGHTCPWDLPPLASSRLEWMRGRRTP